MALERPSRAEPIRVAAWRSAIPVVWTDAHRGHVPGGEVWIGARIPGDEVPERAEAIRDALTGAGAVVVEAAARIRTTRLLRVHDAALVEFLRDAWSGWEAAGYPEDPGQDRVVAYIFPHPGLLDGREPAVPAAASARTGMFAFDTMTPVGPGTWEAARGAADCALTAADLVLGGAPGRVRVHPPAGPPRDARPRTAARATSTTPRSRRRTCARTAPRRVAIVDVDAHHGNGAQSIFRGDDDVLTASVHVDPAAGWFPHFLGFAARERRARTST